MQVSIFEPLFSFSLIILIGGVFIFAALHRWKRLSPDEGNMEIIMLGTMALGLILTTFGSFGGASALSESLAFSSLERKDVSKVVIEGFIKDGTQTGKLEVTTKALVDKIFVGLQKCEEVSNNRLDPGLRNREIVIHTKKARELLLRVHGSVLVPFDKRTNTGLGYFRCPAVIDIVNRWGLDSP